MSTPQPSFKRTGVQDYGTPKSRTPQPEWNVNDDGRGLLTGTLKLFYDHETGKPIDNELISGLPQRGERHPFDERLVCQDVQTSFGSNNIGYCDASYVGLKQDPSGVEWNLSCPTEEEPIETHPMFVKPESEQGSFKVIKSYNKATPVWNSALVDFQGDFSQEFKRFKLCPENVKTDLFGIESYKVSRPSMSVTLHTANKEILDLAILNVGKQYPSVPYGPTWSDVSKIGRSWLFTSLNVSEYATIFKLECEFMLSGIGSDGKGKTWNKLVYPPASSPPPVRSPKYGG